MYGPSCRTLSVSCLYSVRRLVRSGSSAACLASVATPFSDYAAHSIAWRNQYNDTAAATLAKQAALEPDLTKRRTLYKQLTDKVLHEGPYIVLYQPTKRFGLRQNVQGFVWNPMAYAAFRTVSK